MATSPHYRPPPGARAGEALAGVDPFVMPADGKARLFAPAGLADGPRNAGMVHENTDVLALVEQGSGTSPDAATMNPSTTGPGSEFRWLVASDVCKHCTHAACLDVCPTGSLFRTEFGTVVVQEDRVPRRNAVGERAGLHRRAAAPTGGHAAGRIRPRTRHDALTA